LKFENFTHYCSKQWHILHVAVVLDTGLGLRDSVVSDKCPEANANIIYIHIRLIK